MYLSVFWLNLVLTVPPALALRAPLSLAAVGGSLKRMASGTVFVQKTPWPEAPGDSRRSVYIHAKVPGRHSAIGTCGLELLDVGPDGLVNSDGRTRPRAVLSGTLFVSPEFRRQGVAQRLLHEAEGHARWWGVGEMILMVQKGNGAAQSLYEKMGYMRMERTQAHGSQICMRKHLFAPGMHNLQSMAPQHTVVSTGHR
jgi:GNAT superfamily N-acetyltransferase